MKRTTKIGLGFFGFLLVALAIQIYRVDVRKKAWFGPSKTEVYATLDAFGRVLTYNFLPGNKMLISVEGSCVQLADVKGKEGNRFFDLLWKTTLPGRPWPQDFTLVEKGYLPVALEINAQSKSGGDCRGFEPDGKIYFQYFEFGKNQLRTHGMTFTRLTDQNISLLDTEGVVDFLANL